MMPADFKELLRVWNAQGVKFLAVGGYAFGEQIREAAGVLRMPVLCSVGYSCLNAKLW